MRWSLRSRKPEMSRRAADFPDWPEFRMQSSIQSPRVDVIDRDNEVVVRAEMPGMEKDAINISLTESAVTISGETKKEEREEEDNYYRCEIAQGSFSRIIRLPADVDGEKSKARFSDGILELTLPKTERTKRTDLKIEG